MAKSPLKDFIVPVQRPGRKPDEFPIKGLDAESAQKLAKRIAIRRGWKTAEIGKPKEKP